jgi:hypothetical protein
VTSLPRGASFVGRAPVIPAGHLRPPAAVSHNSVSAGFADT